MESILIGKNVKFPRQFSLIEYFEKRLNWGVKNGGDFLINPENIALIQNQRTLKFKDLSKDSGLFAQVLKDYIIREDLLKPNEDGDYLVGICMSPSIELIVALFGILKLGIGYVPFDSAHSEERIIHMLKSSKPWLVITDGDNEKILEKIKNDVKIINIGDIMRKVEELKKQFNNDYCEKLNEAIEFLPSSKFYGNENSERIAALLYTSGSTGLPKGTRLSHRAAMNRIYWNWTEFPFREYCLENNFLKTTLTFVDSIWEIFGPLLYGLSLNLYPRKQTTQAGPLLEKIQQDSITRIFLSPLLLRTIYDTITLIGKEKGRKMLQSVYFVSSTSEILTAQHVEEFYRYFPKDCVIANFYGSTEIFDASYQVIRNKGELKRKVIDEKIPIGGPIYNTAIYLLDENLNLVKSGQAGEIYVTGANLASGYTGIKNTNKFLKNPYSEYKDSYDTLYKTGDFGYIETTPDGDSVLMYKGRTDTQIKVRGFRVDLNEIERIISSSVLIHKCVVLCYKRAEPGQKIISFIEKCDNVENSEILQMFQEKLREFEIPELKVVQKISIMSNDKTDRQKLLKDYEVDKINGNTFEDWNILTDDPKKIDGCSILVKIVSQLGGLCLKEVAENFDKSFYSLGGNSLNSLEAIAHLRNHNYFIEIGKFVSAQSLREISNLIEFRKIKSESDTLNATTVKKDPNFTFENLNETHREEAIKILAESFSLKGDLEKYNKITVDDYYTLIDSFWDFVSENGYCFILRRNSDQKMIGVNILTDYFNEPQEMIVSSQELKYDLEFQHFLEYPQISKLGINGKGEMMHAFLMTTSLDLVASENVIAMELMSEQIMEKGVEYGFKGILACDTNPLSQQLAQIHGWKTLVDFQINQFIAQDGHRPFQDAQDFITVHLNYKKL